MLKWKKLSKLCVLLLTLFLLVPFAYAEGQTATGSANGMGEVKVTLTVENGVVTAATVDTSEETPGFGFDIADTLAEQLIAVGSAEIDGVSGCTITSTAARAAAAQALSELGISTAESSLTPGIYSATAKGFAGEVTVFVEVDEESILNVTVAKCTDTPFNVQSKAVADVPARIVDAQSTMVDATSGATYTSSGIKAAVADCLAQAGNAQKFAVPVVKEALTPADDETVDVLVLGGGGSECMAALYAQNEDLKGEDTGLSVMLVEKQAYLGGSTMLSNGIILAAQPLGDPTLLNDEQMMADYIASMQNETGEVNEHLLEEVTRKGNTDLLTMQQLGMPLMTADSMQAPEAYNSLLSWTVVTHDYDDPSPDGWRQAGDGIGYWLERRLARTNVDVRLNTTADGLLVENGAVVGAEVHDLEHSYRVYAKKVIVACGSMIANEEMMNAFYPETEGCIYYTNGGNTGDGIRMVTEKFGVELVRGPLMIPYFRNGCTPRF